ncbi:MAG: helix-turn-helix transcriptional regulator [Pseudomonadota bacterium]
MNKSTSENHGIMHDQIWNALDRLAQSFGYSPSGLAKQAGLDPTSFNKSKRISSDGKPRWPSTESLARVLAATGATMSDFLSLMDDPEQNNELSMPKYIPIIGFAKAGNKGFFDSDGYPAGDAWDEVQFPDYNGKNDEGTYALKVSGNSMEPLYRNGDILVVSPNASIRKGDRIVIKTDGGEVMAKELQKQTSSRVDLKSLNEDFETRSFDANEVSWMARIIWVSQ